MNEQQATGYATALFLSDKPKWTDERLMGGAMDNIATRHHDRELTLKILNGLCCDLFFRAADIDHPDYSKIPDCVTPVVGTRPILPRSSVDFRKPLDSSYKKRTYTIGTQLPAQQERNPKRSRRRRRR